MSIKPLNFWNFSLSLYEREGVATACLQLQAEYRFDVNLLLFCHWYGSSYGELDPQLLSNAISLSARWHNHVVQPLRTTRNWMKKQEDRSEQFDALRERIKAGELAAEKIQQQEIEKLVLEWNEGENGEIGSAAIGKNIDKLLQAMKLQRDATIDEKLRIISSALEQQS